jgi:hypothetical protein
MRVGARHRQWLTHKCLSLCLSASSSRIIPTAAVLCRLSGCGGSRIALCHSIPVDELVHKCGHVVGAAGSARVCMLYACEHMPGKAVGWWRATELWVG